MVVLEFGCYVLLVCCVFLGGCFVWFRGYLEGMIDVWVEVRVVRIYSMDKIIIEGK